MLGLEDKGYKLDIENFDETLNKFNLTTGRYRRFVLGIEINFDFMEDALFVNASKTGVCSISKS